MLVIRRSAEVLEGLLAKWTTMTARINKDANQEAQEENNNKHTTAN
jgi:hypothetical protein